MSFALMRIDLLVDLANEGEAATDPVQKQVDELLAKAPGAWLPDGYEASFQLVERAIKGANKRGKVILIKAARRVLNEYGRAWTFRKLTAKESRMFLGSAIIVADYPRLVPKNCMDLAVPIQIARERPTSFWARVSATTEIVGFGEKHKQEMLDSLWTRVPEASRELLTAAEARLLREENQLARRLRRLTAKLEVQKKSSDLLAAEAIARRQSILFKVTMSSVSATAITWVLFERMTGIGSILTMAKTIGELRLNGVRPLTVSLPVALRSCDAHIIANAVLTRVSAIRGQDFSGRRTVSSPPFAGRNRNTTRLQGFSWGGTLLRRGKAGGQETLAARLAVTTHRNKHLWPLYTPLTPALMLDECIVALAS